MCFMCRRHGAKSRARFLELFVKAMCESKNYHVSFAVLPGSVGGAPMRGFGKAALDGFGNDRVFETPKGFLSMKNTRVPTKTGSSAAAEKAPRLGAKAQTQAPAPILQKKNY